MARGIRCMDCRNLGTLTLAMVVGRCNVAVEPSVARDCGCFEWPRKGDKR